MTLGFSRATFGNTSAPDETIIDLDVRSASSSSSPRVYESFTVVKDELSIASAGKHIVFDTGPAYATSDDSGTAGFGSQGYLPLASGTYNLELQDIIGNFSWNSAVNEGETANMTVDCGIGFSYDDSGTYNVVQGPRFSIIGEKVGPADAGDHFTVTNFSSFNTNPATISFFTNSYTSAQAPIVPIRLGTFTVPTVQALDNQVPISITITSGDSPNCGLCAKLTYTSAGVTNDGAKLRFRLTKP